MKKESYTIEIDVELLPCPFCGEYPELTGESHIETIIECTCGVSLYKAKENHRFDAIDKWNTRKDSEVAQ